MFELEVNHDRLSISDLPADIRTQFEKYDGNIQGMTILPWEEHCTECAMPMCYTTCDLYEARNDGKCRRFTGGIATIPGVANVQNYVVRIAFKRWGQLMAYANLHMIPVSRARRIERAVYTLDSLVSRIPDHKISIRGRRSLSSRLTRRVKQSLARSGRFRAETAGAPDYFLLEAYNPNSHKVNLSLTINSSDPQEYNAGYQKLLKLDQGFNRCRISIDEIAQRVDLNQKFGISINPNILDKKDEGLSLYFGMLTFVWDSDLAAKDLDKSKSDTTGTHPPHVKVVAWDLDNTIWDGILVEDGADNLKLKPGIIDVIKELDNRGILNTVVSKNNPEDAWSQLQKIGLDKYILYPKIGWEQKGQYLKGLVKQFNVGANTFAFVDDSPFERDEVLSLNPEVRVYDAALYRQLLDRPEFNPPVSLDSSHRREFYQSQQNREEALTSFGGEYLAFLKDCNIRLKIHSPTEKNVDRIHELVQRTNQLNFSGNRYGREQIEELLRNPRYESFVLDCEDRYGQYGTVGFAIVDTDQCQLIDMMFSCRVQSKRVEHAFLAFLLDHYRQSGHKTFSALYHQTERNIKAGAVFDDMRFHKVRTDGSLNTYEFNLADSIPSDNVIHILWNGKECVV